MKTCSSDTAIRSRLLKGHGSNDPRKWCPAGLDRMRTREGLAVQSCSSDQAPPEMSSVPSMIDAVYVPLPFVRTVPDSAHCTVVPLPVERLVTAVSHVSASSSEARSPTNTS